MWLKQEPQSSASICETDSFHSLCFQQSRVSYNDWGILEIYEEIFGGGSKGTGGKKLLRKAVGGGRNPVRQELGKKAKERPAEGKGMGSRK